LLHGQHHDLGVGAGAVVGCSVHDGLWLLEFWSSANSAPTGRGGPEPGRAHQLRRRRDRVDGRPGGGGIADDRNRHGRYDITLLQERFAA